MSDDKITITGKNLLGASLVVVLLIGAGLYLTTGDGEETPAGYMIAGSEVTEEEATDFIDCLDEGGLTVYGAEWCPACGQLAESLGGYEIVDPIWVECTVEGQRCEEEMEGEGVPEVHINGYYETGVIPPETLAEETGCELP